MANVTQILSQIEQGDPTASEQLLPLVYDELRRLAAAKLASENPGHLLLSGYEGLKQRQATISASAKVRLKETARRLVTLYGATDQAGQAAEWKKKLANFEKLKTDR